MYMLRVHVEHQRKQTELENSKYFYGRLMATVANSGFRGPKRHLTEKDFFKFEGDTQADEVDIQALLDDPQIKNRFKKDGR